LSIILFLYNNSITPLSEKNNIFQLNEILNSIFNAQLKLIITKRDYVYATPTLIL